MGEVVQLRKSDLGLMEHTHAFVGSTKTVTPANDYSQHPGAAKHKNESPVAVMGWKAICGEHEDGA